MVYNKLIIPSYLNVCFNIATVTLSVVFPIKLQTMEFVESELKILYGNKAYVKRGKRSWVAGVRMNIPYSSFNQTLIDNTIATKKNVLHCIHLGYAKYYMSLCK